MYPLNDNTTSQQDVRNWSERLGTLAAEQPALPQFTPTPPAPIPTPLAAILQHLRQRHQRQEDAEDKLRVGEFILGR